MLGGSIIRNIYSGFTVGPNIEPRVKTVGRQVSMEPLFPRYGQVVTALTLELKVVGYEDKHFICVTIDQQRRLRNHTHCRRSEKMERDRLKRN